MRIVVVSDTHGNNKDFLEKIIDIEKPDLIFHLGDYVKDGETISKILGIDITIVKGNGDFNSNYNEDELLEIKGKKIFLTHGHKYDVTYNLDRLYYKGLEVGADIVLFGHTHIPVNIHNNELIIMNPGSPSVPRSNDNIRTFGLIEIEDTIKTSIIKI